ncbi:MAG: 50S ribosome-binding GTPase [Pseudomonadota bacterium]|nr:50S ribosome-binding GTPase [Alphaproteobacteria bacterium]MDP5370338.1 50S ribosome-binding GTPase [Pseudomonadota bacterium]
MKVLNVFKRWFLLLVCAVSSVCAIEFVEKDVNGFAARLNSQMTALASQLQHYQTSYPEAGNIVVIGAAGAGKSTLITYLANKTLCAQEGDSGLYLDTADSAGDIKIGHTCEPGTVDITPFYAVDEEIIYWDCPGFGDPRKGEYEIQNAMLIQQLFNSLRSVKVAIVAKEADLTGRALQFVELLEKLTMFKKEQLESCVSLVITKQRDISNVDKRLRTIEDGLDSGSAVYALVDYILSNSERVSKFPYPKDEGAFDASNRPLIVESLATTYVEKLMCAVSLSPASRESIRSLSPKINEQIADFISDDISQAIKNAVYGQISGAISAQGQENPPTATQLKDSFASYIVQLTSLEPTNYVDGLKNFLTELGLDGTVLNDSRFNLFSMLTTFSGLLGEPLSVPDAWGSAFVGTIEELGRLSQVETKKLINKQGDPYEVGDWIWKRDEFKKEGRGLKVKNIKRQFWSKKLESLALVQNITEFTCSLKFVEPEKSEVIDCGETEPRER